MPFHIMIADLLDSYGGSSELIRILNRLGVCTSLDTLSRHIQECTEESKKLGIVQGLNPDQLTVFTIDNIDFLQGFSQVFSGNQHNLSWHGTTVQAVQTKTTPQTKQVDSRRRPHVLLSPINPAGNHERSPLPKRFHGRARTAAELKSDIEHLDEAPHIHQFQPMPAVTSVQVKLEHFQGTTLEEQSIEELTIHATNYFLLKNASTKTMIGMQPFFAISQNLPKPEVGSVAYVDVLDEIADDKHTVLHIIDDIHDKYVCEYNKTFVVLEGDAKTYDVVQALKLEYKNDLNWLIPYPGDWHLLKNYQICLLKPFFEAGLKDLAVCTGYPAASIQACSDFTRTHRFIMESWESMYRHVLRIFLCTCDNQTSSYTKRD